MGIRTRDITGDNPLTAPRPHEAGVDDVLAEAAEDNDADRLITAAVVAMAETYQRAPAPPRPTSGWDDTGPGAKEPATWRLDSTRPS